MVEPVHVIRLLGGASVEAVAQSCVGVGGRRGAVAARSVAQKMILGGVRDAESGDEPYDFLGCSWFTQQIVV